MGFRLNWMRPELSHVSSRDGMTYYHTVEGITGTGFKLPLIDLEHSSARDRYSKISDLVRNLDPDVSLKFKLDVTYRESPFQFDISRKKSLGDLLTVEKNLCLFFEQGSKSHFIKPKKVEALITSRESLRELQAKELSEAEILHYFEKLAHGSANGEILDQGEKVTGVIRLKKPGTVEMDWQTLARLTATLPIPFQISCAVTRIRAARVDFWLRSKLNRDRFSNDVTQGEKVAATADTFREFALAGAQMFEYEWILSLDRWDEESLRRDLRLAKDKVAVLGDPLIETFGAIPTWIATLPGSKSHVPLKEISPKMELFLPIATFGAESQLERVEKSACVFHRQDQSLHTLELFSDRFSAFNAIITGKTGSGKSVFGSVLSRSLLHDSRIHMVKVDVGGSYRQECAEYGGEAIEFHLDRPSGLDPFSFIGGVPSNEARSVLTEFISVLATEDSEQSISKSERAEFEFAITDYFKPPQADPKLNDFILSSECLPRRSALARFAKGGVYENAVCVSAQSNSPRVEPCRYQYYNFENILGAGNRDFSTAVMAAVIASVNLEMIRLSQPEFKNQGKRLVFFCDETKFFIDRNSTFFCLTTANFRKFGHSVILAGQNIEDFYLKKMGEIDRSIVLNCPTRVFFEANVPEPFLKTEFGLSSEHCEVIAGRGGPKVTNGPKSFREFVLQDDLGTRVGRLYLTRKEYWAMTSTRQEVDRIDQLRQHLPWMTGDQAISIMLMQERLVP